MIMMSFVQFFYFIFVARTPQMPHRLSVTRWLDFVFIFGHLQRWNFAELHNLLAKLGSKLCQKQNKAITKLPKSFKISTKGHNFAKSGHAVQHCGSRSGRTSLRCQENNICLNEIQPTFDVKRTAESGSMQGEDATKQYPMSWTN